MSSSPISSSSSRAPDAAAVERFGTLLEVSCPVNVVLGDGQITVRQCLTLERNVVLRLNQLAGEDLQVIANGVQIARGEVVIIEDSTAIRVTEIVRPVPEMER